MINQIFKQLWAQRKNNIWLFLELMLVGVFLWFIVDRTLVALYTYNKPTGFDYSHIYRFKVDVLKPGMTGYVPQESIETTEGDDLMQLIERLKRLEGVESACISYFSCFYSRGNSWSNLMPDTVTELNRSSNFHVRRVSPGFFDVFGVRSEDGSRIDPEKLTSSSVIISKELKELLFPDGNAIGQQVKQDLDEPTLVVSDVTTSIRNTEYEKEELCYFECLIGPTLNEMIEDYGVTSIELMVRVSPNVDKNFIETFPARMGNTTQVNNLFINNIIPISEMRSQVLYSYWKEEKTELSLTIFILINVFFAIIATFWLRTGYRRGEIGLRIALGASRKNVFSHLFLEGICLLALTLIPVIFFALNIVYGGYIDEYRLPFSFWRFFAGILITYILLYGMIALGMWYPATRSANTEPATALHYE